MQIRSRFSFILCFKKDSLFLSITNLKNKEAKKNETLTIVESSFFTIKTKL